MLNFLLFWLICSPFALLSQPIVISLGMDCQAALNARENKLRDQAYPFDWVITKDFESVIKALKDDCKNWLNPKYLEHQGNRILNKYYKIQFIHDFPIVGNHEMTADEATYTTIGTIEPDYKKYLPDVQKKFDRRIKRLLEVLNSTNPVIFLRTYTNSRSARHFVKMMKKKHPQLPFTLAVVSPPPPISPIFEDWNIEGVKFFQAFDRHPAFGWAGENTWKVIFEQLGLLKPSLTQINNPG